MTDPDDDDTLAAEYVLGTLGAEERDRFARRLEGDSALRRSVVAWEDRFSPLLDLYQDVAPPPHLSGLVMARLGEEQNIADASPASNVVELRRSLRRWRLATSGLAALAAALAVWIALAPVRPQEGRFVAVLQKDAASPAIVLDVDVRARRAEIRQVSTDRPSDKSYELWLINPEVGGPRSLGVLSPQGITNASLASYDAAVIARATYAITLEPLGGSPTGAPSGPPILSGRLVDAGP